MPGHDLDATQVRLAADAVNAARRDLDAAVDRREESREAWARWEAAAARFHQALGVLYPDDFWAALERLRNGDASAAEPAIAFLEVDPWCFRSGYAKETILRALKRVDVTPRQAKRLRAVVLRAVDSGDRREFRGYCQLARRLDDHELRARLLDRLRSPDAGTARRALWMLDALRVELGTEDRARVLSIIESAASDLQWWRTARWVGQVARRYADDRWLASLLDRAAGSGSDAPAALRLLGKVPAPPTEVQRRALASHVLSQVATGDDETWLESTAVLADSPDLRRDLLSAYQSAGDPEVQRRAGWAINAIRRAARDGWPGDALDSPER
jgi:hypothetical protein